MLFRSGHYEAAQDRESAYEKLKQQAAQRMQEAPSHAAPSAGGVMDALNDILIGSTGPRGGRREGMLEAAAKSAARSVGSQLGREIMRGVLGGLLGRRR